MWAPPLQNNTHFTLLILQLPVSQIISYRTLGWDALGLLSRQLAQMQDNLPVFQEHHGKGIAGLAALEWFSLNYKVHKFQSTLQANLG